MVLLNEKYLANCFVVKMDLEMKGVLQEFFEKQFRVETSVRKPIPFESFLEMISENPSLYLRDIFQFFYDMVFSYVKEEKADSEISGAFFNKYNIDNLLAVNCENPFYADPIFSERFIDLVKSFKKRTIQNHLILFEGPPGSGKSTFLNNLISKVEEYGRSDDGIMFKTYWRINTEVIQDAMKQGDLFNVFTDETNNVALEQRLISEDIKKRKSIDFSCPRHDHPILQIPKNLRHELLDKVIKDKKFKRKLFEDKEYEWVFKEMPCNICQSIYNVLLDRLKNPLEVFKMIYARRSVFRRLFGVGVSVFNPSDPLVVEPFRNQFIEDYLRTLLRTDNIDFVFSDLSFTNNGVYALMDIKERNLERLFRLHGIISDGVHKVGLIEEHIKSLFIGLVNPEDKAKFIDVQSFRDRIIYVRIPYVLDYKTEIQILKNKFGEEVFQKFLPHTLELFAKLIVATRLDKNNESLRKWIPDPLKYDKFLDKSYLHLKILIFSNELPRWIEDSDVKKIDSSLQKSILKASESDGFKGISGRQSLQLFGDFLEKHQNEVNLVTMEMIVDFFTSVDVPEFKEVPQDLIVVLANDYDYTITQEVKESIYFFNKEEIESQIVNYLFAVNFDIGETIRSPYTNDEIQVSEEFFRNFEKAILGDDATTFEMKKFRKETQHIYVNTTLSQEINLYGKKITETQQFKELYQRFTNNLKENALAPFSSNINFKSALKEYNTPGFDKYDETIKRSIKFLVENLTQKYSYTTEGAIQIVEYVLEHQLDKKY